VKGSLPTWLVSLFAIAFVGGCALAPGATQTPSAPPAATPTAQPSQIPTASPTRAPGTPTPSPVPTATPQAAASCPPSSDGPLVPAIASLQAPEASAVAAVLGSYDYCETSADGLPPAAASLSALRLESRMSELTVYLPDRTPFVGWRGTYTDVADGRDVPAGDADFTAPVASTTFRGPTMGEWLLSLTLDFGPDVGSATYYWRIVVP